MPERKPFLLRVDPKLLDALQAWAADELRSLNGQIEFVLRRAVVESGLFSGKKSPPAGREKRREP